MRNMRFIVAGLTSLLMAGAAFAVPLTAEFTYQGQLTQSGSPANGVFDFRFGLYDAATLGNAIGVVDVADDVVVADGLINVILNDTLAFGAGAFNGQSRWLEIQVRPNGNGAYTTLTPRQPITAAPYALYALSGPGGGGFWAANGNNIYNTNVGRVGIGISSPAFDFDVRGTTAGTTMRIQNPLASSFTDMAIHASATDTAGRFESTSSTSSSSALIGSNLATSGVGVGVYGNTDSPDGRALFGNADNGGYAGYFDGRTYFHDDITIDGIRLGSLAPASIHFPDWNAPGYSMFFMFSEASDNADRMVLSHSPGFANWGLQYQDSHDRFNFLANGTTVFNISLNSQRVGVGTITPKQKLHNTGDYYGRGHFWLHSTAGDGVSGTAYLQARDDSGASSIDLQVRSQAAGQVVDVARFRADTVMQVNRGNIHMNSTGGNGASGYAYLQARDDSGTSTIGLIVSAQNAGQYVPVAAFRADGVTQVNVLEIVGADIAEKFPTSEELRPGMVAAIDPANPGKLCVARGAYNRCVAGVVSGAGDLPVGAILGNLAASENGPAIALSGRVWVYCDAAHQAIEPGDLLTTSDTPGHAMRVSDLPRAQGASIGKAMTGLPQGETGLVLVLVNLQ